MDISYISEGSNLVFVAKQGKEKASILYLSPVYTNYGDALCEIKNIVTKPKYQRQGFMDSLLKEVFECVSEEKEPFVYLYTKNPEYFTKYGFVSVNSKPVLTINPKRASEKLIREAIATQKGFTMLVKDLGTMDFHVVKDSECARAARYLSTFYQNNRELYPVTNEEMVRSLKAECVAEGGDLFMAEFEGIVKGIFILIPSENGTEVKVLAMEEELNAWEICIPTDEKEYQMVRIINVKAFLGMMGSDREFVLAIRIKDDKLIENEGLYLLHASPDGGVINSDKIVNDSFENKGECLSAECEISIEKLAEFAFGCAKAKDTFRIYVKSRESELTKRLDELKGVIWE